MAAIDLSIFDDPEFQALPEEERAKGFAATVGQEPAFQALPKAEQLTGSKRCGHRARGPLALTPRALATEKLGALKAMPDSQSGVADDLRWTASNSGPTLTWEPAHVPCGLRR